jgi:ABC-type antimicrobial peptide transport system permease subunit
MGIRAALGASAGNLRKLILLGGMRLTAIGLAIGLGGTFVTTDALSAMVYGVGVYDAPTIAAVAAVISAAAGLACFFAARRIARIEPAEAVRYH